MRKSLFIVFSSLVPFTLTALPQGATVKQGKVRLKAKEEHILQIKASNKAIIHFDSFNIGEEEIVEFIQPHKKATVLNRIRGNEPSTILGRLISNGQLFLLNGNGVYFGKSATVEVGSLIASTLDLLDEDFLADNFSFFNETHQRGSIINEGHLKASPEGNIVLLASYVENGGQITAEVGNVVLASTEKAVIDFSGDGLISFFVEEPLPSQKIGIKEAGQIVQNVVNAEGLVFGATLIEEGGIVRLVEQSLIESGNIQIEAEYVQVEGTMIATKDLHIQGNEVVCLRDRADQPLLLHAYRDVILKSPNIDILAWQHPQTNLASGRDMTFISNYSISADGHFFAGRDFALITQEGIPTHFESRFDPIVTSVGSVTFGTYTGPSLKVEAGGNIVVTGNIMITGPDALACPAGFCMGDPDCMTLTTVPALILIAGQPPASMNCNPVPATFSGTMFTNPGGTGSTINLTGNLSGFDTATFTGDVVLTGATVITSNEGMVFNGTIDGAFGLTLTGSGQNNSILVNGAIGSMQPLSSLNVSGSMKFSASQPINAGVATIGDNSTTTVTIGPVTTTTSGGITVTSVVFTTMNGATASGGGPINIIQAHTGNGIFLNDAFVADGNITIFDEGYLTFNSTTSMTSNMGNISITATTIGNNPNSLTLSAPLGNITLTATTESVIGPFTSFTIIDTLSATLPGISSESGGVSITANSLVLSGNISTTMGPITIDAPLLLANPISITSMGAPISLASIDDADSFLANAGSSTLSFNGPIGSTTPLTSLSATAAAIFVANDITTTGSIIFIGPLTLTGNSIMEADGMMSFLGSIDGHHNLELAPFNQPLLIFGDVGSITPLTSFSALFFSSFASGSIHAGAVSLDSSFASTISVGDIVTLGSGGIFIGNPSDLILHNILAIGGGNFHASANDFELFGSTITADGSILFNGGIAATLTINQNTDITSNNSSITFNEIEILSSSSTFGLTLNAATTIDADNSTINVGFLNSKSGGQSTFSFIEANSGITITANPINLNENYKVLDGSITLNGPINYFGSKMIASGNVTLNGPVTAFSSLGFSVQSGAIINQNSSVTLTSGTGNLAYSAIDLVNLGGDITTNGGSVNISSDIILNGSNNVTIKTSPTGVIQLENVNGANLGRSLSLISGSGSIAFDNIGNITPLNAFIVSGSTINFQGTFYAAAHQNYTATGNFNFSGANLVTLESFGGQIIFKTGVIQLGPNFLAETNGGNFSFPALVGTSNQNIDILAGSGTVTLGSMGSMLNSILVYGGNIYFTAPITANSFSAIASKSILNQNSPVLITTQGNALFNALGGTVGTLSSPISVNSSFLILAGAPQKLANLIGTSEDGTVHAISTNRPCPLIFNGITLAVCPPGPPPPPSIPARDFYVPGIYSQYCSLASYLYFLPEIVTTDYVRMKNLPLYIRQNNAKSQRFAKSQEENL